MGPCPGLPFVLCLRFALPWTCLALTLPCSACRLPTSALLLDQLDDALPSHLFACSSCSLNSLASILPCLRFTTPWLCFDLPFRCFALPCTDLAWPCLDLAFPCPALICVIIKSIFHFDMYRINNNKVH